MARSLRIEYPGALYHITVRGNRKQDIFLDDHDRIVFLKLLTTATETHNWLCHAYCLMDNHFHLLIETQDANLSIGMRDLNGMYTQTFNKMHQVVGHVFQGRYHAMVIEKEGYLLESARYMVLNPVRAHLVDHPKKWKWSSYRATVGQMNVPSFLTIDWLLSQFTSRKMTAQKQYEQFVMDGIHTGSPFLEARKGIIVGSPMFEHEVWRKVGNEAEELKEVPRSQRIIGRPSLQEIFDEMCDGSKKDRDRFINFARFRCGYPVNEIAKKLKLSPTTVSLIARGMR